MSQAEVAALATNDDLHVDAVPKDRGFDWDAARLRQAVTAINALRPTFVAFGGDMVDDPFDDDQYEAVMRITGDLADIPVYWVAGNHDITPDMRAPTPATIDHYRQRFGADRYTFTRGRSTFIVINSSLWAYPEHAADEFDEQYAWLVDVLKMARDTTPDRIVVLAHHPPFTRQVDEPDNYFNLPGGRRFLLLSLLNEYRVSTYLCGHWHRNGGGMADRLEVVVTGPVGLPLGGDPSGLRIVDVSPEAVSHEYVPLAALTAGVASSTRRARR